ncbi:MAG: hypothetical protein DRN99_05220 [Thermoproteota archaeon]|nr:MAG: hypothetical protein DRN99_05220 [Candidatus Korarchaeota archaeon]
MYGEVKVELTAPAFTAHLYRYFGYYPVWVEVKNSYVKIEAGRAVPVGTLKNVVVEVKIGDAPWQKKSLGDIGPGESKEAEFTRTFQMSWLEGIVHYEVVRVQAKVSWLDPKTGRRESWSGYDEGQMFGKNWVLFRLGLEYPCLYGPSWITPADDTVQHFVKSLGEMVTSSDEGALEAAAMIWDALCRLGVKYVTDPSDPLFDEEDYIQFASQTLSRRGGDCDDLSILFATCLEAVGIHTGLVAVPGHMFPFFILPESGRIVFVEATFLPDHTFSEAVEYALNSYRYHKARNEIIFIIYTHDCWDMGFSPWG